MSDSRSIFNVGCACALAIMSRLFDPFFVPSCKPILNFSKSQNVLTYLLSCQILK